MKKLINNVLIPFAVFIGVVAVWQLIYIAVDNTTVMPDPFAVAKSLGQLLAQKTFYSSVAVTLCRSVICCAVAIAVALILSLVAKLSPLTRKVLLPVITFLRSVPTMSVILIIMLTFKKNITPQVVAFLVVFPVCYSAFDCALTQTQKLDQMCKVFDIDNKTKLTHLYLPTTRPVLGEQIRTAFPLTLKVVISGEAISFPPVGMGVEMSASKSASETALLFAWTVVAVVLSLAFEGTASAIQRRKQCK